MVMDFIKMYDVDLKAFAANMCKGMALSIIYKSVLLIVTEKILLIHNE